MRLSLVKSLFSVLFWVNESGHKPVADWMRVLPLKDRLYLAGLFRDLANDGPESRPKVFKHLEGSLWEIRDMRSPGPGFRVYSGFDGNTIVVVVAGGTKDSQQRDIVTARERLKGCQL
jgi:putative addiction module killer protein